MAFRCQSKNLAGHYWALSPYSHISPIFEHMTCTEAEEVIESLAAVFEREKPYLLQLWKKGKAVP